MAQQVNVFDKLKSLAEGTLEPEEWLQWWQSHDDQVKVAIKPGEFQRLKPRGTTVPVSLAYSSQVEACKILESRGIAFSRSDRYRRGFEELEAAAAPRNDFDGNVALVAEAELHASYTTEFCDRLWAEYQAAGSHSPSLDWLREKLPKEFLWVENPPEWREEPEWPIVKGVPTVFVTQYDVPSNAVTRSRYAYDCTVYVFGYRFDQSSKGHRIAHEVVLQWPD